MEKFVFKTPHVEKATYEPWVPMEKRYASGSTPKDISSETDPYLMPL